MLFRVYITEEEKKRIKPLVIFVISVFVVLAIILLAFIQEGAIIGLVIEGLFACYIIYMFNIQIEVYENYINYRVIKNRRIYFDEINMIVEESGRVGNSIIFIVYSKHKFVVMRQINNASRLIEYMVNEKKIKYVKHEQTTVYKRNW